MKITVLRNLGKGLPNYHEGEVVDVSDDEAEKLIKLGLAEPNSKSLKAVAKPAAVKGVE